MRLEFREPLAGAHILPEAAMELSADLAPVCRSPQERSERRFLAALYARDERGRHDGDAGVSVARSRLVPDHAVLQRKITLRTVWRIGHEHEVGKPRSERHPCERGEIELAIDVRIHQQERVLAEERSGLRDAARGLERLGLPRVHNAQAVARAVAESLHDALREVGHIDYRFAVSRRREALEVPRDERLATRAHHCL